MFNSKYWNVPQNRDRYAVVGTRNKKNLSFTFPKEQHEFVPKLSDYLEKDVPEKYYLPDEKAQTIIAQAMEKLEKMGKCHACITPDRINKRQNGPRAKAEDEPMFTLTAQDLHGVIILEDEKEEESTGGSRQPQIINIANTNPSGHGMNGSVYFAEGLAPTLTTNKGEGIKVMTIENAPFENGIIQAQKNGCGTFVAVAPTLLSSDYKQPPLVIEKRKEQDNGKN